MTNFKISLLAATAAAAATLGGTAAFAQTNSVAIVDPTNAMFAVKAIGPAYQSIGATYKQAFDSAEARERTLQQSLLPLQKKLDTNNDGRLDPAEAEAAQKANRPEVQQIVALQQAAQTEIGNTIKPARLAQAWVLDQVRQKFRTALNTVANNKKIGLVVTADNVVFTAPTTDITDDVTAALDATTPNLSTTPPANWQPDQTTVGLYQQFSAMLQQAAAQQAQGAQQGAAPARPAATTPAPAPAKGTPKRDRNGDPIKQ